MKQPIEDFNDIRIGMPVIYLPVEVEGLVEAAEAKIEAVGWDWAICRYSIEGQDHIGLIVDIEDIQYDAPEAEVPVPVYTKPIIVKGIGEL